MDRVSYKVGVDLKKLGYPITFVGYTKNDHKTPRFESQKNGTIEVPAPYVLEAWGWLWDNTSIQLEISFDRTRNTLYIKDNETGLVKDQSSENLEKAINAALEELSEKGLLI